MVAKIPFLRVIFLSPHNLCLGIVFALCLCATCVMYYRLCNSDAGRLDPCQEFHLEGCYEAGLDCALLPRSCKWCNTTHARPLRSKHCRHCKTCVATFDHHCFWFNNCVGEHNHMLFIGFLVMQLVLICVFFSLGTTIMSAYGRDPEAFPEFESKNDYIGANFILVFLVGIAFFGGLMTLSLILYHVYLAVVNKTTYEQLRPGAFWIHNSGSKTPFSRGIISNIRVFIGMAAKYDRYGPMDWVPKVKYT
ncbi:hypothetical protein KIPB_002948 [Kipferlia bialata]|uniref:Palmitoyltransferase n=1 Tax=Kipferlia bialata TaxID=797122 RepID=A0A9K3CSN1_9EUKA|nr:hypothetical protein KIPB_002948 [Kipferlia bialata]|eukprot:g2948.t1